MLARLAAPALLLAGAAQAQGQAGEARYRFVTSSTTQGAFVDDTTLVRDGDIRTYWTLWVFITPARAPDGRMVSHRRLQSRDDCAARRTEAVRHIAYDESGRVLIDYRPDLGPQSGEPGSTNYDLMRYVCDGRLPGRGGDLPLVTEDMAIQVTRGAAGATPGE